MKIVFTGGVTGGHFYPLIAVAEALHDLAREQHLIEPKLYYLAPTPFDEKTLFENGIAYVRIPAGKMRRYTSLLNFTDPFITLYGTFLALISLFRIYPDVVFSKGGHGSVPTTLAARILRIPVIIHESDAKPGRANLLASNWAVKIAITFESAATYFPKKVQGRIARTGAPIRKALMRTEELGAAQFLNLETNIPTVLVLGGSQGAQAINEVILAALTDLVAIANIIHQTGHANLTDVLNVSAVELTDIPHAERYHPMAYLDEMALQRASGAATVIVSRAGAGSISEIGLWKKPSILIPLPESISHDQRINAYSYARTGAAVVIEQENLAPHILVSEIKRITGDAALAQKMSDAAQGFTDPDAARILAEQMLAISLAHVQ